MTATLAIAAPAIADEAAIPAPTPQQAAPVPFDVTCQTAPTGETCTPVIACILTDAAPRELYAIGRALGVYDGRLQMRLATGPVCAGAWRRVGDRGAAKLTCEDGRRLRIDYVYDDPSTGTVLADGVTNFGEPFRAVSGTYAFEYVRALTESPDLPQLCPVDDAT